MVVVDTSIIIDHLRREDDENSPFRLLIKDIQQDQIAISIVTVQELFVGQSTKRAEINRIVLSFVANLKILPYTYEVAKLAGEIDRDLARPIDLADAAIAATVILNGAKLFTLNSKDFQGIDNLELYLLGHPDPVA